MDKFLSDVYQYRQAVIVLAAAKTGIFDYFVENGEKSLEEMTQFFSWDQRGTEIMLNALCALGYLAKKNEHYHLSDAVNKTLNQHDFPLAKEWLLHEWRLLNRWIHLPEVLESGTPYREPEKKTVHRNHRNFIYSMAHREQENTLVLLENIDLSGHKKLLDLGGGPGLFAIAFLEKYPLLSATVFDTPETEILAREFFQNSAVRNRLQFIAGDFRTAELGKSYDVALLSSILHIYSPEENKKLLQKVYDALLPGGKIVIRDFLLNPDKVGPIIGNLFAVNMLVNTDNGNAYTYREMKNWLIKTGFSHIKRKILKGRMLLLEGVK